MAETRILGATLFIELRPLGGDMEHFAVRYDKDGKPIKTEPKSIPMVVAELYKVRNTIRRDMIRFSGAEQPLKHQMLLAVASAKNPHAVQVGNVQITLCDSEYGEFGSDRVTVRELEAGHDDQSGTVLVAEESSVQVQASGDQS